MNCLHSGECCLTMSPLSPDGVPCPKIVKKEDYFFCGDYENRPDECRNHKFMNSYCPVGAMKLGMKDPVSIGKRIDRGYAMIEYGDENQEQADETLVQIMLGNK